MIPLKPQLAIFDLDGTLIEFHHDFLFAETRRILDLIGHSPVDREQLEYAFSGFDFFSFLAPGRRDEFVEQFWSLFNWTGFPTPKLLPGVLEMFDALQASEIKIAIVTARFMPADQLLAVLTPTGLVQRIAHLMTRPGDHIHWMDKRGVLTEMCRFLGAEPSCAMMVGDVPTDITSAKDVGMASSVAVLSGGIRREILESVKPDLIIPDVSTLKTYLPL